VRGRKSLVAAVGSQELELLTASLDGDPAFLSLMEKVKPLL